ncbi:MAG: hypothetical protein QW356_05440 [Candidatus Hadarchaeales archaeon]
MLYVLRCTRCGETVHTHLLPAVMRCRRCGGDLEILMIREVERV